MKIYSPLSGIVVPLELVPDEAFSQKLVGDGLSIDPTDNILKSPIDGLIQFIHPAQHALTIQAANGAEVLIHIGIDTVQLRGEGFSSLVKVGERVNVGQPLIEFDLDFVSTQAKSLMTQVLVSNPENFKINFVKKNNNQVTSNDVLFEVEAIATSNVQAKLTTGVELKRAFMCSLPTGLHARPAAVLAQVAKKYQADIIIIKNNNKANLKSLVSILSAEIGAKDLFEISALGPDAREALDELTLLIDSGKIEETRMEPASTQEKTEIKPTLTKNITKHLHHYTGVNAAGGLVLGEVYQVKRELVAVNHNRLNINIDLEIQNLKANLSMVQNELQQLVKDLLIKNKKEQAEIFLAHLEVLQDPEITHTCIGKIKNKICAELAWQETINQFIKTLSSLQNEVMATRAHDLQDVGQRVLRKLLKLEQPLNPFQPKGDGPFVLIAQNLTPSDMVLIDHHLVKGIATVEGGASSHVAIMARSMGLAYLAALPTEVLEIRNSTEVILDTNSGVLKTQFSSTEKVNTLNEIEKLKQELSQNVRAALAPAITQDGHQIKVFANVGKKEDAEAALKNGAEGVGLLRSEFLFLHRSSAPTETEQWQQYQEIVSAMQQQGDFKPVIIRTLDVGGDKPLAYLPIPSEENPFLGVRGLRVSLRHPEIFKTQLRALLKVKPSEALQIMFPMVTTLSELLEAKQILFDECKKLNITKISVGIMVEVPSVALMAEVLAPHVDFFSIGSNDLTQYTLAIDRGHRDLAAMADGLHPSVLKLIQITCEAANKHKKMVGVCGGIAGDALAIPLLIGLGVHELSVSVPVIPNVKAQIRNLNYRACKELVNEALKLAEASQVRELVKKLN